MPQRSFSSCNSCCGLLAVILGVLGGSLVHAVNENNADSDLQRSLGPCHMQSSDFDKCIQQALNDLQKYYKTGIPAYHVKPFEPQHSDYVELRRGFAAQGIGNFYLVLRNVFDRGWSNSKVTRFQAHLAEQRITFSQHFPEKTLEGQYEFTASVLGTQIQRQGPWNLTLRDYSQTTDIVRVAGPGSLLKVHVEIDGIGGMEIHAGNLLGPSINPLADTIVNSLWQLGLPFLKPMLSELVSSAFTDIFNESFRNFPLAKFLSAK
ncbi:uncharacterized protein LOC117896797 [Drosophila subobscura]|uniref:uncharacterized protein LOC117896797 n=1 Tax=Drosophila subobscura TaxID=7241 RepID=UPI00155B3855|nr:uncharacterized protein LOC117896797 [Drosophila subobscura]XP_034661187.1 uncharacterized protein LOC117896797 [Drosophila subobscura]